MIMNIRRILSPSLLVCTMLALVRRVVSVPAVTEPVNGGAPNDDIDAESKAAGHRTSYEAIDAYVEREMRRLQMPGVSLAIVAGDQIVHLRGFGRVRPGGTAPTPQTPFYIASLTKSFIALAVMQLVEAGKIELDAPVRRYLPWFRVADPRASAQMTVRHLLHQTSGLPLSSGEMITADFDDSPDANERQARALATLALTRPVGEAFEYSNTNYQLLGLVVEAVSGESHSDYIQRHIFTPLEMNNTYTTPDVAKQNGLVVGHRYWFGVPVAAPDLPLPGGALRATLVISTAEDLAHYLLAHLNGGHFRDVQILSSAGIDELHRGAADFSAAGLGPIVQLLARSFPLGQYAMGWCVDEIGRTRVVSHSGTFPDFAGYMALLPTHKKGIVLLFNACHHWMNPVLAQFGAGATALLAGESPAPGGPFALMPWVLRGQLLLPALQITGVAATMRLLWRWRRDPASRPGERHAWRRHLLLPLISNLSLSALTLRSVLSRRRNYLWLYMPDYTWLAKTCGSFALVWSLLRTGLVLWALRKLSRSSDHG